MTRIEKLYPITVVKSRYGGIYSGGKWIAYYRDVRDDRRWEFFGPDGEAMDDKVNLKSGEYPYIAVGETPDEAVQNLKDKLMDAFYELREDDNDDE